MRSQAATGRGNRPHPGRQRRAGLGAMWVGGTCAGWAGRSDAGLARAWPRGAARPLGWRREGHVVSSERGSSYTRFGIDALMDWAGDSGWLPHTRAWFPVRIPAKRTGRFGSNGPPVSAEMDRGRSVATPRRYGLVRTARGGGRARRWRSLLRRRGCGDVGRPKGCPQGGISTASSGAMTTAVTEPRRRAFGARATTPAGAERSDDEREAHRASALPTRSATATASSQ